MDSIKIFIISIGNIAMYLLQAIFFLLILFYFETEVIGQFGVLISFFMILGFILTLGFPSTYLKLVSEVKSSEDEALCNGTFLFFRFIQFLIFVFLVFIFVSIGFLHNIKMEAFYFFFWGFLLESIGVRITKFFFIGKKFIFKNVIAINISLLMKSILLIIFVYFIPSSLLLLGIIYFISSFIFLVISVVLLKSINFKMPNRTYIKKFLKFSYPLFFMVSLIHIVYYVDILFINLWFSLEEVANYYAAKQIYFFILLIFTSISSLLLTIFSENVSVNKKELNLELIKKIHRLLNLIVVPLFFLILLYSTKIIIFLLDENYELTGLILSILFFNIFIISIDFGNDAQLLAMGKFNFYAKKIIFQNLLSLFLMVFFTSPVFLKLGVIGCAFALVISSIITQIIFRPIIYKKFGLGFYWGSIRNFFIMFLVFVFQLYINQNYSYPLFFIFIFILLDIGLYFFINYLLKGYSKEDIRFLFKILNLKNIQKTILYEFRDVSKEI